MPRQDRVYVDNRPAARMAMSAEDGGPILHHGDGPGECDRLGMREPSVVASAGRFFLFYDGAGPAGWLACLAVSEDLRTWQKLGPILSLGAPGARDSASASSPWLYHEGETWHMFYLGTPLNSGGEDKVPMFPYWTCKAKARALEGPWEKQSITPFSTAANTYRNFTASPGCVIQHGGEYLQYFSATRSNVTTRDAATMSQDEVRAYFSEPQTGKQTPCGRTLGIARTRDLDGEWECDPEPILPSIEQVENTSLYYEPANGYWFLFTNHVGIDTDFMEYTDAIWVYWSQDPTRWDSRNKAVVLDGSNCTWSPTVIGMPSVVPMGKRLAVFYDGHAGPTRGHMHRDIGLAWLDLPLTPCLPDDVECLGKPKPVPASIFAP